MKFYALALPLLLVFAPVGRYRLYAVRGEESLKGLSGFFVIVEKFDRQTGKT